MTAAGDPAWLVVTHPDGARQEVRLTTALTTVGRSDQNVVEVLDPKLSRFHCEVERRHGRWLVRDCNSRNGTQVNGAALVGPRPLGHGDRITLGATVMEFLLHPPPDVRTDRVMVLPRVGAAADPDADATVLQAPGTVLLTPGAEDDRAPGGTTTLGGTTTIGGATTIGAAEIAAAMVAPAADEPHPTRPGQRPTTTFDARQTARIEGPLTPDGDPWRRLAQVTARVIDAGSRGELIERAVQEAPGFVQARGALLALGDERDPEALTVTASLGLDKESRARCLEVARRVLTTRRLVADDRRELGVPLRGRAGVVGALVLHDLPATASAAAPEVEALERLAAIVARTLQTSLLIEDVRREERAAGAHRLAHDLRAALGPGDPVGVAGLDAACVFGPGDGVGRAFFDHVTAPPRAGRAERYLALGDVPDPQAPAPAVGGAPFRRKGERSLVPLVAQAELRGALRTLLTFVPRADEVLAHLDRGARGGAGALSRFGLALARFDPQGGALRLAGAGHPTGVLRRLDGRVELLPASGGPLGAGDEPRLAEREVRWTAGDLVVLVTAGVARGDDALARTAVGLDPTRPAADLARAVLAAAGAHAVGAAPPPDAAVLVLRRVPS